MWQCIVRWLGGMRDFGPFFICIHDDGFGAGTISYCRSADGTEWMFRLQRIGYDRRER